MTLTLPEAKPITFYNAVALTPADGGSTLVRAVAVSGTTLTLDSAIPAGTYTITYAFLGQFAEDDLRTRWNCPTIAETSFDIVELLNEVDLEIGP